MEDLRNEVGKFVEKLSEISENRVPGLSLFKEASSSSSNHGNKTSRLPTQHDNTTYTRDATKY